MSDQSQSGIEGDTLYVVAQADGAGTAVAHTDPECCRIRDSTSLHEYSSDNVNKRICEYCNGDVEYRATGPDGPWKSLENADPDDLVTDGGQTGDSIDRLQVAECPMSWCSFTALVEDPEDEYAAAYEVQDHVNAEHSKKDIETLGEPVAPDNDHSEEQR